MRPFGCPMTILNTLESLGKFDENVDEGFLVGYSVSSKAFRVFNSRTRIVQETLYVNFLENKPSVAGSGPTWLFDIDSLKRTMNYQPVTAENQTNPSAGFQDEFAVEKAGEENDQQYMLFLCGLLPESKFNVSPSSSAQLRKQDDKTKKEAKDKILTVRQNSPNRTNTFSAAGPLNAAASSTHRKSSSIDASQLLDDPDMPELEDITYSDDEDDVGAEANFNNLETYITVSPIPTSRIHKDHPVTQIIGDLSSTTQTRSMTKVEPNRVHQALKDPSWIKAMQEELLQFKMQKVLVLVDLPYGKRAIGTKWVFKNKKDERGIVIRNKARLVAQRHTQEEGIDYKEVFDPVARIEAIRLFLAYASFMGFMVYQINVKSAFLYRTIEEEVYVYQHPGFEDPDHLNKVYKVVKALYGLHQAPRACDSPLLGVNIPRSDEDRLELMELTVFLLPKSDEAEMDQDDVVVLEDDKEEDREDADAIKDVEEAKVNKKVVTAASETVTAARAIITTAEAQLLAATLTAAPARVAAAPSRRRKGVVIRDPELESTTSIIIPAETKSKDKGKKILVEEPKSLKKKQQIEQDEQYPRELHAELNKDIDWDEVIDHMKLKAKEDPIVKKYRAMKRKPQTEAQARKNMMLYLKNVACLRWITSRECPMMTYKLNETPAEKAAKRRKLDEEVEELKRHLQIVPNEDDDVYKEATPLARKIIMFTSTQLILLVERKYPLTRFTLNQMLNTVRLEVKEESEVSLELLKFIRQQHQEGQLE
nr:hypothetical protein [Tanacetum cinerariifolium]